jgi:hypothetical protein
MEDLLSILFIPALLLMGAVTAFEDIKYGRIRNKWVVLSVGYSFVVVAILFFFSNEEIAPFLQRYALNMLFSFILGIILWAARLWSAGDAKLLLAYSSLLPPPLFAYTSYFFPGLVLLSNVLLPYLLFYTGKTLLKTSWQMKLDALKQITSLRNSSSFLLFTFTFSWLGGKISMLIRMVFPLFDSPVTTILCVIIIIVLVKDIYSLSLRRACLGMAAFVVLFDSDHIFQAAFFLHFAIVAFIMFFLRGFILTLGYHTLSTPIYLENLRQGMFPAENFVQFGRRGVIIKKIRVLPLGFVAAAPEIKGKFVNFMIRSPQEGLQRSEVAKIKQYHREQFIKFHTLRIYEHVAFAPFLLAGAIITLIAKGHFIL